MTKSFRNLFLLLALCSVMVAALTGCEQKPQSPAVMSQRFKGITAAAFGRKPPIKMIT